MDGLDSFLISRRLYLFLPIGWKIHCPIVLWKRKGFDLLVDSKIEEILSHKRGWMDRKLLLKSRSSLIADIANRIKALLLVGFDFSKKSLYLVEVSSFYFLYGLGEKVAQSKLFKINDGLFMHALSISKIEEKR